MAEREGESTTLLPSAEPARAVGEKANPDGSAERQRDTGVFGSSAARAAAAASVFALTGLGVMMSRGAGGVLQARHSASVTKSTVTEDLLAQDSRTPRAEGTDDVFAWEVDGVGEQDWEVDGITFKTVALEAYMENDKGWDTSGMYFPEEIVVSYNADLLQKQNEMDDDDDGKGGYVAFNLAWSHQQKGYVNASYVVVIHLNGTIANVLVGTGDLCGQTKNIPRFRAIKPYNDKELMLGAQCNSGYKHNGLKKQLGPNILWDWKYSGTTSRYRYFAGGPDLWRSSHDFEVLEDSMLLTPTRDHRDIEIVDFESGDQIRKYHTWNMTIGMWYDAHEYADTNAPDVNHVQLSEEGLFMSLRYVNTLMMVDFEKAFEDGDDSGMHHEKSYGGIKW